MSGYTTAWVVWIVLFLCFEGMAILDQDPGDTFTEHFRKWLRLNTWSVTTLQQRVALWVTRVVVILFGTWLTLHMAFGWFGGGEGFLG